MATKEQQYEGRLYTQVEVDNMVVEGRMDELQTFQYRMRSEVTVMRGDANYPSAMHFRIDQRVKELNSVLEN